MVSRSKDKDVTTGDSLAGSHADGNSTKSAAAGHAATKGATAVQVDAGNDAARPRARWVAPVLTVAALLVLWQLVCLAGLVPTYLLPSPVQVVQATGVNIADRDQFRIFRGVRGICVRHADSKPQYSVAEFSVFHVLVLP